MDGMKGVLFWAESQVEVQIRAPKTNKNDETTS